MGTVPGFSYAVLRVQADTFSLPQLSPTYPCPTTHLPCWLFPQPPTPPPQPGSHPQLHLSHRAPPALLVPSTPKSQTPILPQPQQSGPQLAPNPLQAPLIPKAQGGKVGLADLGVSGPTPSLSPCSLGPSLGFATFIARRSYRLALCQPRDSTLQKWKFCGFLH